MSDTVSLGTLYEINKEIMRQLPPLQGDDLDKQLASIGAWFSSDMNKRYYMLLCRERADYTIFQFNSENYNKAIKELVSILEERGTILKISYVHAQNAYEIWIKDMNEVYMFMLFDCDDFIIEI